MNAPPDSIFRANDIRGIYGETLTEDGARQIGRALARAGENMALARDGRNSSPALSAALAAGLAEGGANVLDIGTAPTPALYFAAYELANGSGAMITGSHNPPAHNGIKMLLRGKTIGGREALKMLPGKTAKKAGAIRAVDIKEKYADAVCRAAPASRPLHLVLDAGNGAAGEYAPALFAKLGYRVLPLFCDIDGNFPNHHPDPAQPENLTAARDALAESGADAAFVFDGDGDRLGVVLPGAEDWVFPDRLLMLLARDLLSRHAGARVVFDVKCSAHLAPWIRKFGGVPDMQPTGHAFIKSRMRETGALLGGEMSGHFYFAENWRGFDDALLAGARLAAVLGASENPFAELPRAAASPEIVVPIGERCGREIIEKLRREADFGDAKIIAIDGVRAEYEDGFGLARASNTTASLVLRFEGRDEAALRRIREEFRRALARVNVAL
ncbi:MAG: phosphomannomutase/phosphoglucomutase [Gammaproteobacteria bacterium]